ncbi:lysophospholipid acyltransferase family protein, partial [Acinetobacter baumannii]
IDRKGGQTALRAMVQKARSVLDDGRHIIIFPEGTRRMPGAPPAYKHGVVHLYRELGVPVIPVALNSGLFWPRKSFWHHPGTVVVEFLPPIEP